MSCPFTSGLHSECSKEGCALYVQGDCSFAHMGKATIDTKGKLCPLIHGKPCHTECSLFVGTGCAFTAIAAMINKSEEKI